MKSHWGRACGKMGQKKRKKGMWTYYTQENGVRLSFTYYYDFL